MGGRDPAAPGTGAQRASQKTQLRISQGSQPSLQPGGWASRQHHLAGLSTRLSTPSARGSLLQHPRCDAPPVGRAPGAGTVPGWPRSAAKSTQTSPGKG